MIVLLAVGVPSKWYQGPGRELVVGEWWDACGAMVVYFAARFLWPRAPASPLALAVWGALIADELLQLLHAGWLERLRATTVGAVVLGSGFSLLDLLVISAAVAAAWAIDRRAAPRFRQPDTHFRRQS